MLISVRQLSKLWNVNPQGVLHVGAHLAEESSEYNKYSWGPVTWVEAQPDKAAAIREKLDPSFNHVIEGVVWGESKVRKSFNMASNGESSSLLEFGTHRIKYPLITLQKKIEIETIRLDEVIPQDFDGDFLNLDIQGAELEALVGLGKIIQNFKWVYTEVNKEEVYVDCATIQKLDEFLHIHGFTRRTTRWVLGKGWGDALYIRTTRDSPNPLKRTVSAMLDSLFYGRQVISLIKSKLVREEY